LLLGLGGKDPAGTVSKMGDVDEKNMRRLREFLTKVPPSLKLQIDELLRKFQEDFRITGMVEINYE